jgi:hypothetical protein
MNGRNETMSHAVGEVGRLPQLWMNGSGDLLPEDAALAHNQTVEDHFVQKLKDTNPSITKEEIQVQVARMHRQVKAWHAAMTEMLLYGEVHIDPRDFA